MLNGVRTLRRRARRWVVATFAGEDDSGAGGIIHICLGQYLRNILKANLVFLG